MFRLQTQHVFLTYSQVGDRSVDSLREFLRSLSAPVEKFVIGLENHEDGGRHFHVYMVFASRYESRNERFLDWDGVHPNIQKVKGRLDGPDAKRVYDYSTKDNETTVWPEGAKFEFRAGKPSKFAAIFAASSTTEALSILAEVSPRDYLGNRERFEYGFSKHFAPPAQEFVSDFSSDSFAPCEVLQSWVANNIGYVNVFIVFRWRTYFINSGPQKPGFRPKSLLLLGPTKLGKTSWARSLGCHVFISGGFNAEMFKQRYGYFVFDDVAPIADSLKRMWKQWFGGQRDFTITGKYVKPFQVSGGVPSILCLNEDDYEEHFETKVNSAWSKENMIIVRVLTPLYKTNWVPGGN